MNVLINTKNINTNTNTKYYIYVNGFWPGFIDRTDANHIGFFENLFQKTILSNYELTDDINKANVLFESGFSSSFIHTKKWKYKIFYSGEPYLSNRHEYLQIKHTIDYTKTYYNSQNIKNAKYDIILFSEENNQKNQVNVPLFVYYIHGNDFFNKLLTRPPVTKMPEKFCCFIVSNGDCIIRNKMFEVLNSYKKVDSYGKYGNNMNSVLQYDYWTNEFLEFISHYKFIICFENSKFATYSTEKIINPYLAGIIPVYWSSPFIHKVINKDSMIFLEDETPEAFQDVYNKIIELDNSDEKYLEYVNRQAITSEGYQYWNENYTIDKIAEKMNKNIEQENHCKYVCSRGILKSCDVHSSTPSSSIQHLFNYDFTHFKDNTSIYVCSTAIPHFIREVVPQITFRYILVSGDCDPPVPNSLFQTHEDFQRFLNSPYLIHWFSQNCIQTHHPKLSQIPIGLDYHTLYCNPMHEWGPTASPVNQEKELENIKKGSSPFWNRKRQGYSNFHFFTRSAYGYDRIDAMNKISKELVYYEREKISRKDTWSHQSQYAFVISPHGNGLDCHRTWEAIALGCIPIVKTSPLDPLFKDLPVLIVESWNLITQELLNNTIEEYKIKLETNAFQMEKLTLEYWVNKINEKKK